MKKLYFIALFLLVACTSAQDVQRECNAMTDSFAAEVSCIADFVAADPYLSGDSFVQEYVYTGKVLADKVRAGALSENEARMRFAKAYNRLRLEQSRMAAYDAAAWDRLAPRETDCRLHGDRIACTSW